MSLNRKQLGLFVFLALVGVVLLSAASFSFAAAQEENDSFCASCHTQPESTYYQRSLTAATDLASAHREKKNVRCIDCHSGDGLEGRVTAEMMGAQNAVKWYSGLATQPAPLLYPIEDSNCTKCHAEVLTQGHDSNSRTVNFGPKGHYHTYLAQWKKADKNAARCTDCHNGHELGGKAQDSWVVTATANPNCDACHKLMGTE